MRVDVDRGVRTCVDFRRLEVKILRRGIRDALHVPMQDVRSN